MTAPATQPARELPAVSWRATNRTGIGHAFTGKGPALCGEPNQEPRYDWPRRDRCDICTERLGLLL